MNKLFSASFLLAIIISSAIAFEKYDEEYEQHIENFFKLRAAQANKDKKDSDPQIPVPYSPAQIQKEQSDLKQDYSRVQSWPTPSKALGAISAVALDVYKNVVIFHRAERVWNSETFDITTNVFKQRDLGPISSNTIISFDRETGNVLSDWGSNLFYMPHGLHINGNYYYLTDVAMHQVFRFNIKTSTTKAELVLGEAFRPGRSAKMFCKPTSVVSLENGDFFVADGYCNSRIVKFNFAGEKILEWGRSTFSGGNNPVAAPNTFAVPHALTLIPEKQQLCVADRENGRVQCFNCADGKFVAQYHSPIVGDRLFSVDYANGTLFVVNGPESRPDIIKVAGYTFDLEGGEVTSRFGSFADPHDLAVTSDAKEVYVADLSADESGHRIHKFVLNGLKPTITSGDTATTPAKLNVRRGDTALLVGSIVLLFTALTVGIAILISRKKRRGRKIFVKPWEKSSRIKNIFTDYNQFEKVSQNDDFATENQGEFA